MQFLGYPIYLHVNCVFVGAFSKVFWGIGLSDARTLFITRWYGGQCGFMRLAPAPVMRARARFSSPSTPSSGEPYGAWLWNQALEYWCCAKTNADTQTRPPFSSHTRRFQVNDLAANFAEWSIRWFASCAYLRSSDLLYATPGHEDFAAPPRGRTKAKDRSSRRSPFPASCSFSFGWLTVTALAERQSPR